MEAPKDENPFDGYNTSHKSLLLDTIAITSSRYGDGSISPFMNSFSRDTTIKLGDETSPVNVAPARKVLHELPDQLLFREALLSTDAAGLTYEWIEEDPRTSTARDLMIHAGYLSELEQFLVKDGVIHRSDRISTDIQLQPRKSINLLHNGQTYRIGSEQNMNIVSTPLVQNNSTIIKDTQLSRGLISYWIGNEYTTANTMSVLPFHSTVEFTLPYGLLTQSNEFQESVQEFSELLKIIGNGITSISIMYNSFVSDIDNLCIQLHHAFTEKQIQELKQQPELFHSFQSYLHHFIQGTINENKIVISFGSEDMMEALLDPQLILTDLSDTVMHQLKISANKSEKHKTKIIEFLAKEAQHPRPLRRSSRQNRQSNSNSSPDL